MLKINAIKNIFNSFFNSYSDIFFIKGSLSGLIILAITFINYNAGVSGVLSVLSAYLVARLLGYQSTFLSTGYYTYNALLVGLAIGYMFEISILSVLMITIAGGLTMIITIVTSQVFYRLFGLQILSVPFIIVSILVYLSSASFTNLYVAGLYSHNNILDLNVFYFWFSGYLKSLGAIIFMPNEMTGLLITALLLINSRILFILSFSGFIFGITLYGLFTGSIETASQDVSGFNYILIAMAIGGIFNIPSLKSYALAFLGVAFATLIASAGHVFWSQYGLPIFTLPFTMVTLSFIYVLNFLNYSLKTQVYVGSPEQNLEYYLATTNRFVTNFAAISLPFKGRWSSWQGFNGKWTHKGIYQHAYDFVVCDSENKTYLNNGKKLEDYYCFGREVLSPVRGRVVKIIHYLADNPIGTVDIINNWGNEIMIEDTRGYIIKLAHFASYSIYVVEGQWVDVGTLLGHCGNSGNSPQPHIHIQMQLDYTPTAATHPFIFVNYMQQGTYNVSGLPVVNQDVTHCQFNLYYDQLTNFVIDEVFDFDVYFKNNKIDTFTFKVKMSELSYYYFESNRGKLYFGKQYGNFYFYSNEGNDSYLNKLYLALSTMPLSYEPELNWSDNINNSLIMGRWQANAASLLNSIYNKWISSHANYYYIDESTVCGTIKNSFFDIEIKTSIKLDPITRIKEFQVGDYKFVQILK